MASYEGKIREMERSNEELKRSFQLSEANLKEVITFMRSMQLQDSSQVQGVKDMMREESENLSREREKSRALFLEVVRLGENQQKQLAMTSGAA